MEREVIVVTQKEYDEWLNKQTSLYDATVKPTLTKTDSPAADSIKTEIKKPQAMLSTK